MKTFDVTFRMRLDEFCNENGIDTLDPIRGLITSAFYGGVQAVAEKQKPVAWMPIATAPKSGEFLIGVWSGDWNNPQETFTVFHAHGHESGPSWAMRGRYRTEEGGAYVIAGWLPLPLYTAPPQRPWVGLTDEEIQHIYNSVEVDADSDESNDFARAIEAKLRSKNT